MKIVLTGEIDLESEVDIQYLLKKFQDDFYFLKIYDKTKVKN